MLYKPNFDRRLHHVSQSWLFVTSSCLVIRHVSETTHTSDMDNTTQSNQVNTLVPSGSKFHQDQSEMYHSYGTLWKPGSFCFVAWTYFICCCRTFNQHIKVNFPNNLGKGRWYWFGHTHTYTHTYTHTHTNTHTHTYTPREEGHINNICVCGDRQIHNQNYNLVIYLSTHLNN